MATVDENLAASEALRNETVDTAQAFIDQIKAFVDTSFTIDPPGSRLFSITTGGGLIGAIESQPERPDGLDFVSPGNVADPPTAVIRDAVDPVLPDAPLDPPVVEIPAAPVIVFPTEPSEPFIADVALPVSPDFVLPTVPNLIDIVVPSAPAVNLPTFTAIIPEDDLPFVSIPLNFAEPEFIDELLEEIKDQTLSDLQNGGFGIDTRDEEALVGRLRDREIRAGRTGEEQVLRNFASRGWRLPTGSLTDQLLNAQQQSQEKVSAGEREVFVVRADLFRKTREFQLANGTTLESMLNTQFGFRQQRALQAAEFTSQYAVTVFNATVNRFNAQLSAFQTAASAFEIEVRAQIAKTEIFRTEVEAAKLKSDINQQEIQVYSAQIAAVGQLVNIFETEMRAAAIATDIERLKIQQFSERVNSFTAQVQAQGAKIGVFDAQVRGELAKVDVYKSQVGTFEAEIRAVEAQTRIQNLNVQADIDVAKINLATYAGQIDQFKANLSREVERIQSLTSVYNSDISSFNSLIAGWAAFYTSADRATEAFLRQISEDAKLTQAQTELELNKQSEEVRLSLEAAKAGAALQTSLAEALSAINQGLIVKEDTTT